MNLQPAALEQSELDLDPEVGRDRAWLMSAMDALNGRFGKDTLHVASTGRERLTRIWGMRQDRLTPQYTTRWEDIPTARA